MQSLVGLEALTLVGGDVWIGGDVPLDDLSGLESLEAANWLSVHNNSVTSLAGLGSLASLPTLYVTDCELLESVGDFAALTSVGSITLDNLPELSDVSGFARLAITDSFVKVANADALASLQGFEALREIGGDLIIENNGALTDISALHGVTHVGGNVEFAANASLSDEAIAALIAAIGEENIDGSISIP